MDALLRWDVAGVDSGSQGFNGNRLLDQQTFLHDPRGVSGRALLNRRVLQVLIVDDDRDTTTGLAMLVRHWGHVARVANDGATALSVAAEQLPDVLLLDLGMPGMDGCEVARRLRLGGNASAACFIIAISGWADEAHRRQCVAAGIDLFLMKPVAASVMETLLTLESERLKGRAENRESLAPRATPSRRVGKLPAGPPWGEPCSVRIAV